MRYYFLLAGSRKDLFFLNDKITKKLTETDKDVPEVPPEPTVLGAEPVNTVRIMGC